MHLELDRDGEQFEPGLQGPDLSERLSPIVMIRLPAGLSAICALRHDWVRKEDFNFPAATFQTRHSFGDESLNEK
jgi:hypothetical protein